MSQLYHNIRNSDGIWINTEVFREAANHHTKYGRYCDAEPSSDPYSEYQQFWKEEEKKCIQGVQVGGARITGDHYNYLNYSQIRVTKQMSADQELLALAKEERKRAVGAKKQRFFPAFWDGDHEYFHVLDIARWGASPRYVEKLNLGVKIHPEDLSGGLHVAIGKARRKGFSFKNGSIVANRFKREPDSISVVAAYDSKFLYPEGTMAMVQDYVDWYNKHTAWRRRKTIDRIDHLKDAYVMNLDGVNVEEGFKSVIMSISCRDNADAIRGKDGTLILMEESGKWPNLAATLDSTLPTLRDGIFTTGIMLVFGTGGGNNTNWESFEELFYSPGASGFMRFENIWDKGARGTYCGYFFPSEQNLIGFIDKHGNSIKDKAWDYEEKRRERIRQEAKDPEKLRRHKMEEARSPGEAFSRGANNLFPTEEIDEWYREVKAQKLWANGVNGDIRTSSEGQLYFQHDPEKKAILQYPHKGIEDLEGCIVQYYPPFKINGIVPDDLYIICHDPYHFDKSTDTESLGVSYVLMNPNNVVPGFHGGDLIVASYIGRPASTDDYNRRLLNLAMYYNAKIGFENDRGDVVGFAKRNREMFQYLEGEFELGWSDSMNNRLGRGFGMSMGGGRENKKKGTGDIFLRDWFSTVRYVDHDTGRVVKNLHTIIDPGLLEETLKYGVGNFDRISALRIGMYHMKELQYQDRNVSRSRIKGSVKKFLNTKLCG